jgi:hypothetical protein
LPQLLKDLISSCWDADPANRPTTSEIWNTLYDWLSSIDSEKDTEFTRQYHEAKAEFKQLLTKSITSSLSLDSYTSRLFDYKNLPQPQNSQELNDQFYNSKNKLEFLTNSMELFSIQEIIEVQKKAQIEVPPKN